jgi:hypothetical protein
MVYRCTVDTVSYAVDIGSSAVDTGSYAEDTGSSAAVMATQKTPSVLQYCRRRQLKVHKIENFFGFDLEICTFS